MKAKIKVLIADDHPVFRRGLHLIIESDERLSVVAEAADGLRALELIRETTPDVAVLDVNMPEMNGFDAAREIKKSGSQIEIIFLTMHKDEAMFNTALDLEVKGYLLKESAVDDIIAGIKAVAAGEHFISQPLTTFLFNRSRRARDFKESKPAIETLTEAERLILKFVAEDKTSREIADLLFISVRTVERHRQNVCNKLQIHGSNGLLRYAVAHKQQLL